MATLLAFTVLVLYQERERRLSDAAEHVAQLSDVITRSTRFAMLQARPDYVHNIIDDVARQENIDRVRIFNKEGTIIDSTMPRRSASRWTARPRLLAVPPDRAAARGRAEARARAHLRDRGRPPHARQHGGDPQRALVRQRRMPRASGRDRRSSACSTSSIRSTRSTARCASALTIVTLSLAFVLVASALVSLFVHRLVVPAAARSRSRRQAARRRQSRRADPGAQRGRVRAARGLVQQHDARAGRTRRGTWRRRSRKERASCAAPRRKPRAARSSPRSACSPRASRTS